ncbi:hypothetical protein [Metabacillus bambusae]|jgi:hypothetical protein|uniref:Uncharacterized protein n=1 Tax=Metabacillus bambusae TaxID=2795218 RepID=A0ABS3N1D3_9BACI|nr:hypothetical protein [Metabacillus bambusae]MBO1512071.1 hypothetical protein [Metabacillus bambusae]
MKFVNIPIENRLDTNPFVHYLQEGDLYYKSENELILKHLHELPQDFMEMTLFDIDGYGCVYSFSHITDLEVGEIETKVAVFKKI